MLDVGCGIGGNAVYLCVRGLGVEGLAPDALQQERFIKNTNSQVPFYLTRFEDFPTSRSYDLVLFSESSQYIAVDDLAQGAARLLSSGGYLLLADMMRSDGEYKEGIFSNCHVTSELQATLVQARFNLTKTEDISSQVAPTIDLCVDNFRTFGLTTVKYIANVVAIAKRYGVRKASRTEAPNALPPLYTIARLAFKRWLEKPIIEELAARAIFESYLCYSIQLWQLSKGV
ncbi:class I SAM-dependent methyltransferase [Nostoc sp.]|uniref:class I SAM-dependent methyltransferase n=1 Tax=Nostoc sp. TaxID=1180 RepID=UPI002FFA7B2D